MSLIQTPPSDQIRVYLKLPAWIPVELVDFSSIRVNGDLTPRKKSMSISDYDEDGIADLVININRRDLFKKSFSKETPEITVTGNLKNGHMFKGSHSWESGSE